MKPDELAQVVRRCLSASPADRFQSAHDLRAELTPVHDPTAWTRADAEAFWHAVDRHRFGA